MFAESNVQMLPLAHKHRIPGSVFVVVYPTIVARASERLDEHKRCERAVHEALGIAFDLPRIRAVQVDEVRVPR